MRLETETGKSGGRTELTRQPKRNSAAAPQMRPWHGPMPHRVWSLASRHAACSLSAPWRTSSQRQTMVSSAGSSRSCGSSAQACCRARTKPRRRRRWAGETPRVFELAGCGQCGNLPLEQRAVRRRRCRWARPRSRHSGLKFASARRWRRIRSRCGSRVARAARCWAPGENRRPDNRSRRHLVSRPDAG